MTLGLRGRHSGYQSVANQNLIYLVQEIMIENDDDTDIDNDNEENDLDDGNEHPVIIVLFIFALLFKFVTWRQARLQAESALAEAQARESELMFEVDKLRSAKRSLEVKAKETAAAASRVGVDTEGVLRQGEEVGGFMFSWFHFVFISFRFVSIRLFVP